MYKCVIWDLFFFLSFVRDFVQVVPGGGIQSDARYRCSNRAAVAVAKASRVMHGLIYCTGVPGSRSIEVSSFVRWRQAT